ncbi:MAG: hypothetical protein KDI77_16985 [Gammaproteobacteria bacterium]|nr:hypothetical protein [Gammaproteobacteria bacterium]
MCALKNRRNTLQLIAYLQYGGTARSLFDEGLKSTGIKYQQMANIIGGRRDASSVDCRLFERALRLEEGYLDQPHWGEILDEKEKTLIATSRKLRAGTADADSVAQLLTIIAGLSTPDTKPDKEAR